MDKNQVLSESLVDHISDTAFWVAHHRAVESANEQGLFSDPFAEILAGEKGRRIATSMERAKFTSWIVTLRTVMIDHFIADAIHNCDVDCVVNLGAGLDARPYRMAFPAHVTWIEADYSEMILYKQSKLEGFKPQVTLEQVGIDLANRDERRRFLSEIAPRFKKILVLTEGVIPYLSPDSVRELSQDLTVLPQVSYWVVEYFHANVLQFMKRQKWKKMEKAPFRFFPDDWDAFFRDLQWQPKEMRYFGVDSELAKRKSPYPLPMKLFQALMPKPKKEAFKRNTGFAWLARF